MASALQTVTVQISGETYTRIFQFSNPKQAREFYLDVRHVPGVVDVTMEGWPTKLYSKASVAIEELKETIR